jgi:leader peptidase (prepilin peptidase) / N-methyltransferase
VDLAELPLPFALTLAGIFGLMVGSFFNVVIYRMPRGESVVWPPSRCTRCGYRIKPFQNIPVLSWVALGGRCKGCRAPISAEYPLVEALTGLIAVLTAGGLLVYGRHLHLDFKLGLAFLALASVPIFIIDFRHYLIPDLLTYPGMVFGLGLSFIPGGMTPLRSVVGWAGAGLLLWLVGFTASRLLKKEAMGLGDVKLIAMAGACFGLQTALMGLVFASVLGTVVGVPMLLLRRLDENRHIPFGPYICLGVMAAAFFAGPLLDWYLGSVGLAPDP